MSKHRHHKNNLVHQHCTRISLRLIEAQKNIRILDAIKWTDDIEEDFFKNQFKKQPKVDREYYHRNPLPFEVASKIDEFHEILRDVHSTFGHFSPFTRLISIRCHEYIRALEMLDQRGTPAFSKISIELYGNPKDAFYLGGPRLIDMGTHLFEMLTVLDVQLQNEKDEKRYTAEEASELLQARLNTYFGAHEQDIHVMVSDGIIADASAGADTIKLKQGKKFSDRDLHCLEVHEGWVHIGTTINGALQPYCPFLSKGSPSCSALQEGLAVLTELITFASYPSRLRKITNRNIAMNKVLDGASFIDVFHYFRECGCDDRESYDHTVRIFRGSTPEGGPFTKDLSYARGFVAAFNFILYALSKHQIDVMDLLFVGKVTMQDIPLLIELRDLGLIEPPRFLPPQIRDPSGLSSWMAAFLYLENFKFQEVQENFRYMLPAKD